MSDRIESAWKKCKDWITAFDGGATEAYLPDVQLSQLSLALERISAVARKFKYIPIWPNDTEDSVIQKHYDLQQVTAFVEKGSVLTLNFVYAINLGEFNFDVHLIIDRMGIDLIDVDVVWWSDYAFPKGVDQKSRFERILEHFFFLQELFGSEYLYIGPENLSHPKDGESWVEV